MVVCTGKWVATAFSFSFSFFFKLAQDDVKQVHSVTVATDCRAALSLIMVQYILGDGARCCNEIGLGQDALAVVQ